ncbi:MAG: HAD family phosphatase [Candidatus Marinimicrobia bacterium]|nr:HAD family phosphatase [Candidatus Neomarinimicrobiota bacterium]MBL7011242.1 HAD family phosphatase [Candidatus Neomarinimicrobiota bacterium]MBL7031543.1 HAD family phosphatase [Candidatus Neomarinimicrobiota bacterium]
MIKTIFFDIGNVLIHIHPDRYIQYLADSTDLPIDVIKDAFPLEVHYAYERGEISGHEFFLSFREALPQPCCLKESDFWRGWQKLLGKETAVVPLLQTLSANYDIWLLSNTNPQHIRDELESQVSFLDYIDGGIYSFDAGSRKPDSAIYEYALEKSGAKANESVFIDDLKDNINAAEKQGFIGIHYVGEDQLLEDLNNLGIEIEKMVASV